MLTDDKFDQIIKTHANNDNPPALEDITPGVLAQISEYKVTDLSFINKAMWYCTATAAAMIFLTLSIGHYLPETTDKSSPSEIVFADTTESLEILWSNN